ncbi:hypothetical protein GUJ93_ZPchr0001g32442 [Zizania palustris]|uniref:Uncharacterized protein n=1 Tax=Zizania palustris TaxID=103762 RepID=A0A8J5SBZ4_ZIZPA|nr:hypothetical protein GUJ93_ZPchr0001g32442 [Zizania palustris]
MLLMFPVTADAHICAKEAVDADSSDDEQGVHYMWGSSANNRKRRAVFDLSDDEDDNVVAIASPKPPEQRITDSVTEAAQESKPKQENIENKREMESDVKSHTGWADSSQCKIKSGKIVNQSGITLTEKMNGPPTNDNKQDHPTEIGSTSPKRREVLKTWIDE